MRQVTKYQIHSVSSYVYLHTKKNQKTVKRFRIFCSQPSILGQFPNKQFGPVLSLYSALTSCTISEKSNDSILRKILKIRIFLKTNQTRGLPKNRAPPLLTHLCPLTSCKRSEKNILPNSEISVTN